MTNFTNQHHEQLSDAQIERNQLQNRIAVGRGAIFEGTRAVELLDPSLSVVAQPASPAYPPAIQEAVTDLAAYRQRSAEDDARAAVYAIYEENGYGRAA
jgi:hypothetical protein